MTQEDYYKRQIELIKAQNKKIERSYIELKKKEIQVEEREAEAKMALDLMERKTEKLEIANAKLEAAFQELENLHTKKAKLISMIVHEIRTPIAKIQGAVENVHDGFIGPINEEQKEFLDIAIRGSADLRLLVSNLLDAYKQETGTLTMSMERINAVEVIERVIDDFKPLATKKCVDLYLMINADAISINADKFRIKQVITNLLNNAFKFTPKGGSIEVEISQQTKLMTVKVSDSGCGIPEKDIEKIFGTCYQVDNETTRASEGTGIGLQICQIIVENHGGKIWAENNQDQGVSFVFEIPLEN